MIGPNILISILEERYRNDIFLQEARGKLPRVPSFVQSGPLSAGKPPRTAKYTARFLKSKYNKIVSEHGEEKAYDVFVDRYGAEARDILGLKKPTEQPGLFDDIPDTPKPTEQPGLFDDIPDTPKPDSVEVEVATNNAPPKAAHPAESPATRTSAATNIDTVQVDVAQGNVIDPEILDPVAYRRTSAITNDPESRALARIRRDSLATELARREKYPLVRYTKYPIQKYTNFPIQKYRYPPVDPPIPPREPPINTRGFQFPYPPVFGSDSGVLYPSDRGGAVRGDIGLMGDISGMSRLAHRYKIA